MTVFMPGWVWLIPVIQTVVGTRILCKLNANVLVFFREYVWKI